VTLMHDHQQRERLVAEAAHTVLVAYDRHRNAQELTKTFLTSLACESL
jgi:hypothetical protein